MTFTDHGVGCSLTPQEHFTIDSVGSHGDNYRKSNSNTKDVFFVIDAFTCAGWHARFVGDFNIGVCDVLVKRLSSENGLINNPKLITIYLENAVLG